MTIGRAVFIGNCVSSDFVQFNCGFREATGLYHQEVEERPVAVFPLAIQVRISFEMPFFLPISNSPLERTYAQ